MLNLGLFNKCIIYFDKYIFVIIQKKVYLHKS